MTGNASKTNSVLVEITENRVRYIYDELVQVYGDPFKAPKPIPATSRQAHRTKRRIKIAQEQIINGVVGGSDGMPTAR